MTQIDVYTYAQTAGGTWFAIRNPGIYLSINYQLINVDAVEPVDICNAPVSPDMEPIDETRYEVRFERFVETVSSPVSTSECARITGELTGAALSRNTLAMSQYVSEDRPYLCAYDVFLYVPARSECDVYVRSGSRAIDGLDGVTTALTGRCITTDPSAPPTLSPPPPPPARGPTSPPPHAPPTTDTPDDGLTTVSIIMIATASAWACVVCVVYASGASRNFRRTSDTRQVDASKVAFAPPRNAIGARGSRV